MQEVKDIPKIKARDRDSHKTNFGRLFVLAGSQGMLGAACLCTQACMRSGAGLVTLGIPASLQPYAAIKLTSAMTKGFAETPEHTLSDTGLDAILEFAEKQDVVALGPGLSQHPNTQQLVQRLVPFISKPLVIDADGLNALAKQPNLLEQRKALTIVTPHPGEFIRIYKMGQESNLQPETLSKHRITYAGSFAREFHCVVVLKYARTIVTDGELYYINTTGNPGMANGGSGDVLTGVIAALVGQHFSGWEAAQIGVWAHGYAGDLVAQELGEMGMLAEDVVLRLPLAFRALQQPLPTPRQEV